MRRATPSAARRLCLLATLVAAAVWAASVDPNARTDAPARATTQLGVGSALPVAYAASHAGGSQSPLREFAPVTPLAVELSTEALVSRTEGATDVDGAAAVAPVTKRGGFSGYERRVVDGDAHYMIDPGTTVLHFMHTTPFLTVREAQRVLEDCENYAAAHGGWTTHRHRDYPTHDLPVDDIPELRAWLYPVLRERLVPAMADAYGLDRHHMRFRDVFVARYASKGQRLLRAHRDGSILSFNTLLNAPADFAGGGTYVHALNRTLQAEQGRLFMHCSKFMHEGAPVLRGMRYILIGFLQLADDLLNTTFTNHKHFRQVPKEWTDEDIVQKILRQDVRDKAWDRVGDRWRDASLKQREADEAAAKAEAEAEAAEAEAAKSAQRAAAGLNEDDDDPLANVPLGLAGMGLAAPVEEGQPPVSRNVPSITIVWPAEGDMVDPASDTLSLVVRPVDLDLLPASVDSGDATGGVLVCFRSGSPLMLRLLDTGFADCTAAIPPAEEGAFIPIKTSMGISGPWPRGTVLRLEAALHSPATGAPLRCADCHASVDVFVGVAMGGA